MKFSHSMLGNLRHLSFKIALLQGPETLQDQYFKKNRVDLPSQEFPFLLTVIIVVRLQRDTIVYDG